MKYLFLFFNVLYVFTLPLRADTTSVELEPSINIGFETYAVAFREVGGRTDVWLTVAATRGENTLRSLAQASVDTQSFSSPTHIRDAQLNEPSALYNGVPHFNPCDSNELVFVSDRKSGATGRRSNDVYLARHVDGIWTVKRAPFNSSVWDDTPVFGPRGDYIYFSSDRLSPGSGRADIFRVHRIAGVWSEPVAVEGLAHSDRHETSPFVFEDRIYFSSGKSGDQDIWSAKLDVSTGKLRTKPVSLDIHGVNVLGSNEYHPVISPGGGWFYFSSDRVVGTDRKFHIYRAQLPRARRDVLLRVTARTTIRDSQKRQYFGDLDSISSVRTRVHARDIATGKEQTLETDDDGVVALVIADASDNRASADASTRSFVLFAEPPMSGFVSSVDTIVVRTSSACNVQLEHVIYLDDTVTRKHKCEFAFRTFNVPFFITTYWCPTTRKYRAYTPCTSLFTDDLACKEIQQPDYCKSNEAYAYTFTPAKLVRSTRAAENCVSYKEFNDSGDVWATQVDRNIEHMRDEVRSALNDPCLQAAVAEGMPIVVTYMGTTDDRAIDQKCTYTGAAYEQIRAIAPHIAVDSAVVPFISKHRRFNSGGYGGRAGGNQLLSDLRSLYFAILFDALCNETIPQYRDMRLRGLLQVRSHGQAIDQRNLPYSLKRAAGVEIRVPGYEKTFTGRPVTVGKRVVLCPPDGGCNQSP